MSAPSSASPSNYIPSGGTLFGHPTGLFALFFAEMWERFSYYGMRALLVLYMIKGFAGYGDSDAYRVYGAYTALVYMTPFIGGMIADRLLGARRAVVLGGLLMASGHLLMTVESELPFFVALALLIVGNGFFKPNISTIVGSLYPPGSAQRDSGFTIFYMGINLGAMLAPLVCGYVGETYGWHYGFGLATIGMLVGLAVFVVPSAIARGLILTTAILTALGMMGLHLTDHPILLAINAFGAVALAVSGVISFVALGRAGLPAGAGAPPDPTLLSRPVGGVPLEWLVYAGALAVVPIGAGLVWSNRVVTLIPAITLEALQASESAVTRLAGTLLGEISTPTGLTLFVTGVIALAYIGWSAWQSTKVEAQRLGVVVVLMFFSLLFWAFFEQAGSSINLFTDRNVDRVFDERAIGATEVGGTVKIELTQEQLGYPVGAEIFTLSHLDELRENKLGALPDLTGLVGTGVPIGQIRPDGAAAAAGLQQGDIVVGLTGTDDDGKPIGGPVAKLNDLVAHLRAQAAGDTVTVEVLRGEARQKVQAVLTGRDGESIVVDWPVTQAHVGMGIGATEVPASTFQAANPLFIIVFGLLLSMLWQGLAKRSLEPNIPLKFALGLFQLGLGFVALWWGTTAADDRGMVTVFWLILGYLLHTTGELCLSPVGLSMVTKLSPARLVSTVMGAWFLATAFSSYLSSVIAVFTGVGEGGGDGLVPAPIETVHVYGSVFGTIGIAAVISAVVLVALSPILVKWTHGAK